MIEPISPKQREYDKSYASYGVTKFIEKNGDGCRGVILEISNNGKVAILYAINGKHTGKIIEVKEVNPDQWPKVV